MLALDRRDAPPEWVDNEGDWLEEVAKRRKANEKKEKKDKKELFAPHWSEYKSYIARHDVIAKCAYCELRRDRSREIDVEHIRPKELVTHWIAEGVDERDLLYPPKVWDEKEQRFVDQHPREDPASKRVGYEWLAYRWSNYLLACKDCNSGWKRNFFPVRDPSKRWASRADEDRDEQPLLLDPTERGFDPDVHFRWRDDGKVDPLTERATATIITCGLNRELLRIERFRARQGLMYVINRLDAAMKSKDSTGVEVSHARLKVLTEASAQFCAMARAFVTAEFASRGMSVPRPWRRRSLVAP